MCKVVKEKLDSAGVEYEICSDIEIMKTKGISYVPVVEADGEIMNTARTFKWLEGKQ